MYSHIKHLTSLVVPPGAEAPGLNKYDAILHEDVCISILKTAVL